MTFYNSIPGYTLLGYGAAAASCPTHPIVGPGTGLPGGACEYAQPGGANATITCGPGTSLNRDATSCDKGGGGFSLSGKWMGLPIWGWLVGVGVIAAFVLMSKKSTAMRPNRNPRKRRRAKKLRRRIARDWRFRRYHRPYPGERAEMRARVGGSSAKAKKRRRARLKRSIGRLYGKVTESRRYGYAR